MKRQNVGETDRVIRIIVGASLAYGAWLTRPASIMARPIEGDIMTLLLAAGAVVVVTGLTGWCPFYAVFGISTKRRVRH